jgi:hypothetical protein
MHRHSIDLGGLLFGLAFAIAGTSFLVRETTNTTVDPAWATGLGLMLLGAVALVVTLGRATRRNRYDAAMPEFPPAPERRGSDS